MSWLIKSISVLFVLFCLGSSAIAAEGSSVAGPIGGTDIRSAQLPPPGIYGGTIQLYTEAHQFFDGNGDLVPSLSALDLNRLRAAPFLLAVPDVEMFGGRIGFFGIFPAGRECGRLFAASPTRCISGFGDPYLEVGWSRFFGKMRSSHFAGAYPIPEGLTIAGGFGTVVPVGRYDVRDATLQGLVIGNNIWDFAPIVALTYVTPPLLSEGTEISAKMYFNNYLENPATQYQTGTLINIDFAVSERFGRFQGGFAGYYACQPAYDKEFGIRASPDGRRIEVLSIGGVLAYDLPEFNASLKIKALTTIIEHNTVRSPGVVVGWIKKF